MMFLALLERQERSGSNLEKHKARFSGPYVFKVIHFGMHEILSLWEISIMPS